MKRTVFDVFHPVVAAVYFAGMLVFSMAVVHPVYIVLALAGGLAYRLYLSGVRETLKALTWQIPLILLITCVNPLFSSVGSTELFRIGTRAVYLESVFYGACFGALLVTVILWFSNISQVLDVEKVSSLLGNRAPTLALMFSMVLRLVPRLLVQGREVQSVHRVSRPSDAQTKRGRMKEAVRLNSVLMGWSMEDSLETSDSLRARGWGAASKRTTYRRYRLRFRDLFLLCVVLLLFVANSALALVAVGQFRFYPELSVLVPWWGYVPAFLGAFLPLILQGIRELQWKL